MQDALYVTKRDGTLQKISFEKVQTRITNLCLGRINIDKKLVIFPPLQHTNPIMISQVVIQGIKNKITTSELDQLALETAANRIVQHHEYDDLAARIGMSDLQKSTPSTLLECARILYNTQDTLGRHKPLISAAVWEVIQQHHEALEAMIDYRRDYNYKFFGIQTLKKIYLLKKNDQIIERPQHMIMRVSIGLYHDDLEAIRDNYDLMSQHYFTHATPTLFNCGTPKPTLISCFLLQICDDSISGIYDTVKKFAIISAGSGGIGFHQHNLRAANSQIYGSNGKTDSIIKFLRVLNETSAHVNQGGRRPASFASYLSFWHADILDWIRAKRNTGEERNRARRLYYGAWISDLFMERVRDQKEWSLMSPDDCPGLDECYGEEFKQLYERYEAEGKYRKRIPARDLMDELITTELETGMPYICFKDHVNHKSNQQNVGVIKSSNLCVSGDTLILTDQGHQRIDQLVGQKVNIWNGYEWSDVKPFQTGTDQELLHIKFSDGSELKCTKYHKFYILENATTWNSERIQNATKFDAKDLKPGMKLVKHSFPKIEGKETNFVNPYTHGFFCGDGTYDNIVSGEMPHPCKWKSQPGTSYCKRHQYFQTENDEPTDICQGASCEKKPRITLYDEKKELRPYIEYITASEDSSGRINCRLNWNIAPKYTVPMNHTTEIKLLWFAGYCDADGTIAKNGTNESLQVASVHLEFLQKVKLMLNTLGLTPKVTLNREEHKQMLPDGNDGLKEYQCKSIYRLLVNSNDLYSLVQMGFSPKRLKISGNKPQRNARQFVKIESVTPIKDQLFDTYCFTEPKKHTGIFNGVLTGQCTEIMEYSSPEETACCVLASIALPKFVETDADGNVSFNYQMFERVVTRVVKGLNQVIDVNKYTTECAERSNMRHRPLGIGVQGLADLFYMFRTTFGEPLAKKLNREIFEAMYYYAMKASMELAKVDGPYSTFEGSPLSRGVFQFDMWGVEPDYDRFDWETLRADVIAHGVRNSLLIAIMPTASTSQLLGNSECVEPYNSNIYVRSTLAGIFQVVNKFLMQDLMDLGIYSDAIRDAIIINNGSIQHIPEIPDDLKRIYRTSWELEMKDVLDMSADRGAFVCQSQSLNLFKEVSDDPNSIIGQRERLRRMYFYAWKIKLKTGQYYLRTRPAKDPIKVTVSMTKERKRLVQEAETKIECTDEICTVCSG